MKAEREECSLTECTISHSRSKSGSKPGSWYPSRSRKISTQVEKWGSEICPWVASLLYQHCEYSQLLGKAEKINPKYKKLKSINSPSPPCHSSDSYRDTAAKSPQCSSFTIAHIKKREERVIWNICLGIGISYLNDVISKGNIVSFRHLPATVTTMLPKEW